MVSNRHVKCPIVVVYDIQISLDHHRIIFISNCSLPRVFCDMSQKIQKYSGSAKMLVVGVVTMIYIVCAGWISNTINIISYLCVSEEFSVTFNEFSVTCHRKLSLECYKNCSAHINYHATCSICIKLTLE